MGKLTTHILDTANGRPANGVTIALWKISETDQTKLKTLETNSDGRTDTPLLTLEEMQTGTYELVFEIGSYFENTLPEGSPGFLDSVPIRFSISDANANYHVPLLVSPWSYSTYRGS